MNNQISLEEAIKTAIEYEKKVRDVYINAIKNVPEDIGKKIFKVLADEEQHHIDYLNRRLEEFQKDGKIQFEVLKTVIPSKTQIENDIHNIETKVKIGDNRVEEELLRQAFEAELETKTYYENLVNKLKDDEKALFSRFLEIEEAHGAIVQAEIDSITKMGFWFDIMEFDLEAG